MATTTAAADAVQATGPTAWQTVTQWGSDAAKWFDEKIVQTVAPYFQAFLTHVENNKEAYTWGAVGVAIGATCALIIGYWCRDKAPAAEEGEKTGTKAPVPAEENKGEKAATA